MKTNSKSFQRSLNEVILGMHCQVKLLEGHYILSYTLILNYTYTILSYTLILNLLWPSLFDTTVVHVLIVLDYSEVYLEFYPLANKHLMGIFNVLNIDIVLDQSGQSSSFPQRTYNTWRNISKISNICILTTLLI